MTRIWIVSATAILLLSGCSTTSMKGSPFYTAEYEQREGPDPHRVNLGVVYYRDPVLHVLWPLMEFGPKYLAVRPVYSVYDRDTDHPVYNVLWPIAKFDPGGERYRIFPVYWGDEYFNVVPLYWHEGDPFSGTGHNALLPLWMWSREDDGHYLGLLWPLYANYRYPGREGWWLWPAYGSMRKDDSRYHYYAWPFIHSYTNSSGSGNLVVPLWYYGRGDDRTVFLSLPYSRSMAARPGATSWDLTLPLGYRAWSGDTLRWAFFPALSWGRQGGDASDYWFALGLGHYGRAPDSLSHHVIPIYLYSRDPEVRRFYTLPWWSKKYADGTGWNMLFPAYYYGRGDDESAFYSLPWLCSKRADGSGWHTSIPLYFRGYSENASSFYSLPWFQKKYGDGSEWHTSIPFYLYARSDDRTAVYSLPWSRLKKADGSGWHTTIPLYYHSYSTNSSAFYSLPWLSEKRADGSGWNASFPFYFSSSSTHGSFMLTPVYARKLQADGALAWRCFIPFVYFNETYDAHFLTLLGGRWRLGDQYNWLALPLLSGGVRDADRGRNIWLAGVAGQRWNPEERSHYVFPFYYAAPGRAFISLPYTAWSRDQRQTRVVPPLLSGWYSENDISGAVLAAGLAGYRKGGEWPYHYAFPFYYANPRKGTFLSLPYAAWSRDDRKTRLIPPLLSGWYSENGASGSFLAAGLAGHRRGDANAYSYVFPFYFYAPEKDSFLSLPYCTWRNGERQNHMIPLLLSGWNTEPYASEVLLAGGLAAWRRERGELAASHVLPFYMHAKDDYTYTLLFGQDRRINYYATPLAGSYRRGSGKSGSWLFPAYRHRRDSAGNVQGYYFPLGYYNRSEKRSNHGFWGLYDYEEWERFSGEGDEKRGTVENKSIHYLLSLGQFDERWEYGAAGEDGTASLSSYRKDDYLFPLWSHDIRDDRSAGKRLETSSVLGLLYDTRHEKESGDKEHDYLRRRVLWRLYHYEKINGDMSTDVFPGITVDAYKSGYYKFSFLWRVLRYEKDPENESTKFDLLFIPLKR